MVLLAMNLNEYNYEFVRIKEPFILKDFLFKTFKFLFSKPELFLVAMIAYHLLIYIFTIATGQEMPAKVWLVLGSGDVASVEREMESIGSLKSIITNWIFLAVILILDFALLIIIKSEFKSLKLTYPKILLLEIGLFALGVMNPYVRTGLLFFSANTLQIAIAYRWFIKKWFVFRYFFLAGAYALIIRLVLYFFYLLFGRYLWF